MKENKKILSKIIITIFLMIIVRLLASIPLPGVDISSLSTVINQLPFMEFLKMFSGGNLESFSIIATGITPVITASLIVQLLGISFPNFLDKEDPEKTAKINKIASIPITFLQSFAVMKLLKVETNNLGHLITSMLILTAGTFILIWISSKITEYGIGNGVSIILSANILSGFVGGIKSTNIFISLFVLILVSILIIYWQDAQIKIPVKYAKKIVGRKMYGGNSSFIPLKASVSGVLPIIYTTTIISFIIGIISLIKNNSFIIELLNPSTWFNIQKLWPTLGIIPYVLLIYVFSIFSAEENINHYEISKNLQNGGAMIPGIRSGKPTSDYIKEKTKKVIFIGFIGLTIIWIIPSIIQGLSKTPIIFTGTSLIIVIGTLLEIVEQIKNMKQYGNYGGFLK